MWRGDENNVGIEQIPPVVVSTDESRYGAGKRPGMMLANVQVWRWQMSRYDAGNFGKSTSGSVWRWSLELEKNGNGDSLTIPNPFRWRLRDDVTDGRK